MASDRLRTIEAKLKLSKEGDATIFREVAQDLDNLGESAEKSIGRLQDKLSRGFGASEKDIASARVALEEYRKAMDLAADAGADIGEGATARLQELESQLENATASVGEFRKAQQDARRDIDDATEAAGGQMENLGSLQGVMKKLAEETGNLGLLMKANLIAQLVELAATINGKVVDGLNSMSKALGGQGDEFRLVGGILPVYQGGIDKVSESIVRLTTNLGENEEALAQQGKAYEDAQAKYLALLEKRSAADKKAAEATKEAAKAEAEREKDRIEAAEKAEAERAKAEEREAKEAERRAADAAKAAEKAKADQEKADKAAQERWAREEAAAKKAAEALAEVNKQAAEAPNTAPYDDIADSLNRVAEAASGALQGLQAVTNGSGKFAEMHKGASGFWEGVKEREAGGVE